jgi:tRNA (adenine37-N6)-methyltransferase
LLRDIKRSTLHISGIGHFLRAERLFAAPFQEEKKVTSIETIRPGEVSTTLPEQSDAGVYFIGRIRTPWPARGDCPRRGDPNGPECRIEVDPRWQAGLEGVADQSRLQVLYWMDEARRDLVVQVPRHTGRRSGTFALRSPVRPNPIASSVVEVVSVHDNVVVVRGLDCKDGTPLIDLKPARD